MSDPARDPHEIFGTHDHVFVSGQNRCYACGVTVQEARAEAQTQMLTEAFSRLAAVLEKLEAKL
jgi:hypothetical protein